MLNKGYDYLEFQLRGLRNQLFYYYDFYYKETGIIFLQINVQELVSLFQELFIYDRNIYSTYFFGLLNSYYLIYYDDYFKEDFFFNLYLFYFFYSLNYYQDHPDYGNLEYIKESYNLVHQVIIFVPDSCFTLIWELVQIVIVTFIQDLKNLQIYLICFSNDVSQRHHSHIIQSLQINFYYACCFSLDHVSQNFYKNFKIFEMGLVLS